MHGDNTDMKKLTLSIILLSGVLLFAAGCGLLQEPEQVSAPIEATPLELPTATSEAIIESQPTESPDQLETEESQQVEGELRIFSINPEESQVRFELDEDLRGQRITVVGITDQVAGEIGVNLSDLSTTQVGVIQINARGLSTDNNFRNRAIQNEILDTGSFEFITFTPTAINGLPDSVEIGEEVSFTLDGDLTIRDVTSPVSFTIVAKADSENQLSGTASAVISRGDFGLNIPSVPNVANVEEDVELYIDFVATTQ